MSTYTNLSLRVKKYLEDMGMSPLLYQDMMRVRPEAVRWLTMRELDAYGLVGTDPAYEDAQDSRAAMIRGISKQEWLGRKARANRECERPLNEIPLGGPVQKAFADCLSRIYGPVLVPAR